MLRPLAATLLFLCAAPASAQTCIASAGEARSVSIALSPMAGGACFHTVTLHEGAGCARDHVLARATEHCSTTRRLAVTDAGVLVSVRAPRASRRDWAIVRVFTVGEGARSLELSLDDLPETAALRGSVRVSVEGDAVLFRDRRSEVRIAVNDLGSRLR